MTENGTNHFKSSHGHDRGTPVTIHDVWIKNVWVELATAAVKSTSRTTLDRLNVFLTFFFVIAPVTSASSKCEQVFIQFKNNQLFWEEECPRSLIHSSTSKLHKIKLLYILTLFYVSSLYNVPTSIWRLEYFITNCLSVYKRYSKP